MDVPGGPDRVWRSIKELASAYARSPQLPSPSVMEEDLQAIIRENLGRDIDRRLIVFYLRELAELTQAERARRTTHGVVDSAPDDAESAKNL